MRFEEPVSQHFFKLRCIPCNNFNQKLIKHSFTIYPNGVCSDDTDTWGNLIQYGSMQSEHNYFAFVSSGEIEIEPYCIKADEAEPVFLQDTQLTAPSLMMKQFMWHSVEHNSKMEYVLFLTDKVHNYMRYTPGSTNSKTTAMQAFAGREGVCQDYTHILISLCRTAGIPARYVNGFVQGTGETHAWAEVFIDNAWWGIDPTNNIKIEYGYIKLAHGRDAADCHVNRGVFTGNTQQQTEIRVIVDEI